MINFQCHATILTALLLVLTPDVQAHPTGNMIEVGEYVLWSYINPIDDPGHHACIMIWKEGVEPKVFVRSEYAASDYMLYNKLDEIYMIERRYIQEAQNHEIRIWKTTIDSKPKVIWDWFRDEWHIGERGFFMRSDSQIVFGNYPDIYSLKMGERPTIYFDFNQPIKRIRSVRSNQILLLGDDSCFLVQHDGAILQQWDALNSNDVVDPPLNRNQVFDADYNDGRLLLAYWGNRSFDIIDAKGRREILVKQTEPLTPHWVAFSSDGIFLFSSELIFDGSAPKPHLIKINKQREKLIWGI